jgi:hypothetical protein
MNGIGRDSQVPSLRDWGECRVLPSVRKLKPTVNKVPSLRDLGGSKVLPSVRKLKHTVNKVSSLRDLGECKVLPSVRISLNFQLYDNAIYNRA